MIVLEEQIAEVITSNENSHNFNISSAVLSLRSSIPMITSSVIGTASVNKTVILITGCAGFIGFHLSKFLLDQGFNVLGVDCITTYYSKKLKTDRLKILRKHKNFEFLQLDLTKHTELEKLPKKYDIKYIVHLAAQPGVRYSISNPREYIKHNISAHLNILELCREIPNLDRLVYASSSSVYGNNTKTPFSIDDRTDEPVSLYAATKKADEVMSHSYSHLFGFKAIGLRFFTVYGPFGRPDMAPYIFADKIWNNKPIEVYNHGNMMRDFTYIDDIIYGILGALNLQFHGHRVYNLGHNKPESIMRFISLLEENIGKKAIIEYKDMQPGDVTTTYADIESSKNDLKYDPVTSIEAGIPKFIEWFKEYN